MDIFLKLKYRRLKQRVQRNGVPIAGTVTEIIDKFAVPLEFARKNGIPEDLRPIIRISYQTPEGTEQLLQMRTPDVSPYAPVGRIVPLRYVNEKGRHIAFPEQMLQEEDKA